LGRLDEAKDTLEQTLGKNPDRLVYRFDSLFIALVRNDEETLDRDIGWLQSRADDPAAFDLQTGVSDFNGQLRRSDVLSKRSSELHLSQGEKQNAAQNETLNAVNRSVVGQCDQAKSKVAAGLVLSRGKIELSNAAVALANCGDTAQAQSIADELQKRFPKD